MASCWNTSYFELERCPTRRIAISRSRPEREELRKKALPYYNVPARGRVTHGSDADRILSCLDQRAVADRHVRRHLPGAFRGIDGTLSIGKLERARDNWDGWQ